MFSLMTSFTECYQDILYTRRVGSPAVHCSGPLGDEIEFAHEAAAVVHEHAQFQTLDAHAFARERAADFPGAPLQVEPTYLRYPVDLSSRFVFPSRRLRYIAACTFLPHRSRRFHGQCFVRPLVIIFMTRYVQRDLPLRTRRDSSSLHRRA